MSEPEILNKSGFMLEDGTPVITRQKVVKGLENWKGKLVQSVCEHQFECLIPEFKKRAIKANRFRDQGIPLWRCRKCKDYTWSM